MCACSSHCGIIVPFIYDELMISIYSLDLYTLQEHFKMKRIKRMFEKSKIVRDILVSKDDLVTFMVFCLS